MSDTQRGLQAIYDHLDTFAADKPILQRGANGMITKVIDRLILNPNDPMKRVEVGIEIIANHIFGRLIVTSPLLSMSELPDDPAARACVLQEFMVLTGSPNDYLEYGIDETRSYLIVRHMIKASQDIEAIIDDLVAARSAFVQAIIDLPQTIDTILRTCAPIEDTSP